MNLKQYLNVTYLKVEEVNKEDQWEIKEINTEQVQEENNKIKTHLVLKMYCNGVEKLLQLNQTNLKTIIDLFGEVSGNVLYKKLVFKLIETEFGGKPTQGIRIDVDRTKLINNIN